MTGLIHLLLNLKLVNNRKKKPYPSVYLHVSISNKQGFINFIVEPSMCVLGDMIDKIFEQILTDEQSRTSKSDMGDTPEPM